MPTAIQQKMDDNKINGINVYSGIESHFEVEVAHLLNEEFSSLKAGFENDTRVKSVSLTNSNGVNLIVIADGNYTIKDIKAHVVNTSGSIENYTANYEISQ